MPGASEFLAGFSVYPGLSMAGFQVISAIATEQSVVRWNEYQYPITVTFRWSQPGGATQASVNNLATSFANYVSGVRVIHSDSGRPYECTFGAANKYESTANTLTGHYLGHSKRISKAVAQSLGDRS